MELTVPGKICILWSLTSCSSPCTSDTPKQPCHCVSSSGHPLRNYVMIFVRLPGMTVTSGNPFSKPYVLSAHCGRQAHLAQDREPVLRYLNW
jgi:hypothetical protein